MAWVDSQGQDRYASGVRSSAPLLFIAILLAFGAAAPVCAGPELALSGPVTRDDYEAGMRVFRPAAERGDPIAQYNLGRLYSQGRGAPADFAQAIVWFRKAAEQGHAGAEARLGEMLDKGWGAPRDSAQAAAWYRKAAAQGNADAAADLLGVYAQTAQSAPAMAPGGRFPELMNGIFGPGRWRETSGYRTLAAENRLRAHGALTVPPGVVSRHSMGTPAAPGAYDIVVAGMSPGEAAGRIRRSGVAFRRLFAESAHGDQGPHLHVEPIQDVGGGASPSRAGGRKTSL